MLEPLDNAAFTERQVLLGISAQWAIAVYYNMPSPRPYIPPKSCANLSLTQHTRIQTTRTITITPLRSAVDSVLDFCAPPQLASSVKEHLSLTKKTPGFESLPYHIFRNDVKHYTPNVETGIL